MNTMSTLIANLNQDLANELSAIIQYTVYSAKVMGPYRPELAKFFQAEIADEQLHAQFLADKIVTLGGEPTTIPSPVPLATTPQAMLEAVMAAEKMAIEGYTRRSEEAKALGLISLALDLEDFIRDETNHYEEVKKILTGW